MSCGSVAGIRSGSSRRPKNTMMSSTPASNGMPARANSKNAKGRAPASSAALLTMMLTGVPVSASSEPAWAEKASGMSIWEGGRSALVATTTTTGMSAATAPLTLIRAVRTATRRQTTTSRLERLSPPRASSCCPAHAVTPVESNASPTTKSVAMKMTVGSPKPRERVVEVEDPGQPQRDRDPDRDDAERDARFDMNATTAMTRMSNVIATGLMRGA